MTNDEFSADEARRHFADLLGVIKHGGTHVTVTRHGKPLAVVVPVDWYEQAKALISKEGQS